MAQGKASQLRLQGIIANHLYPAGAEFAEFVLQAAYGSQKGKVVQSYVFLGADAGGNEIKKEIGADLDYFSVNVELGVSDINHFV